MIIKRKAGLTILSAFFLVVVTSTATYFATSYYVAKQVYQKGYSQGSKKSKANYKTGYDKGYDEAWGYAVKTFNTGACTGTPTPNDALGCDKPASSTRDSQPAPVYVNPDPRYCSSYTYGINNQFTSTSCF